MLTLRRSAGMTNTVENYDGSITSRPRQLVYAESVEQIQSILRNPRDFPSPVRAMGSNHSVTPCASSDGTIIKMSRMNRVLGIDRKNMTITAKPAFHFFGPPSVSPARHSKCF